MFLMTVVSFVAFFDVLLPFLIQPSLALSTSVEESVFKYPALIALLPFLNLARGEE